MKRSLSAPGPYLLPRLAAALLGNFLLIQPLLIEPALADLNFKASYNKVQLAAASGEGKDSASKDAIQASVNNAAQGVVQVAGNGSLAKQDPFPLSSKFSRRLQKYSGINWLSAAIASQAATIVVHHKLGGKVKVKVKTYSLTDLIAGKVKSFSIDVKEPRLSGIGLGEVSVISCNPIWYVYGKNKQGDRGLKSAVIMSVRANLSQKQIARALENPTVASRLHGLKLDLPGIGEQQLEVVKPRVEIIDDLLKLEGTLVTKGGSLASGVPVTIVARPVLVGDSQIVLDQMKVDGPDIVEPEKFADFTAKLLNPVVDFARMDKKDHAFRLDSLKVSGRDGDVEGGGRLLLVPRAGGSQLAQRGALVR